MVHAGSSGCQDRPGPESSETPVRNQSLPLLIGTTPIKFDKFDKFEFEFTDVAGSSYALLKTQQSYRLPTSLPVYHERKVSRVGAWPSPSATVVSVGIFTISKPAFRPVGNLRLVSRRTVKRSSTNFPNQKSDTRTNRSRIRCKFAMYCVSRNSNSGPMLQLT